MNHINFSPIFRYIIPMYLMLITFDVISPIFLAIFISLWGSQIPSGPRQVQICARLMPGWVASAGWPSTNENLATPVAPNTLQQVKTPILQRIADVKIDRKSRSRLGDKIDQAATKSTQSIMAVKIVVKAFQSPRCIWGNVLPLFRDGIAILVSLLSVVLLV